MDRAYYKELAARTLRRSGELQERYAELEATLETQKGRTQSMFREMCDHSGRADVLESDLVAANARIATLEAERDELRGLVEWAFSNQVTVLPRPGGFFRAYFRITEVLGSAESSVLAALRAARAKASGKAEGGGS